MPHRLYISALALFAATIAAVSGQASAGKMDAYGDPLPPGAVARLGTIRFRHGDAIGFAAFLPDGKSVISVAADKTIRVWEFPSGKEIRRINLAAADDREFMPSGGDFLLRAAELPVALSKDGKTIATFFEAPASNKVRGPRQIRLHDVATGKELRALDTGGRNVIVLVFSSDGEHLIARDGNSKFHVWDWANGKALQGFDAKGEHGQENRRPSPRSSPSFGMR